MSSRIAGSDPTNVTAVYCLHFLGGSAREWVYVEEHLPAWMRLIAIDLPGFGDAATSSGYSIAEMATSVARTIRAKTPGNWLLVGHSMGAKVVAALARRIEDGGEGLPGLKGLMTVAGSPPAPEPMDEDQRQRMLGWFHGDAARSKAEAVEYVAQNVGRPVPPTRLEQAASDVLRANKAAWTAWLDRESRADFSAEIGILHTPTVIVAGADDPQLGPEAQLKLMAPHFANHRLAAFAGARHLLPLECPRELAALMVEHAESAVVSLRVAS